MRLFWIGDLVEIAVQPDAKASVPRSHSQLTGSAPHKHLIGDGDDDDEDVDGGDDDDDPAHKKFCEDTSDQRC